MSEQTDWLPSGIDPSVPSTARIYDYLLGGKDNFPADREAGDKVAAALPEVPRAVIANRGFLVAAVRRIASAGITQFLDLGTGIPTSPNVHEIARETHSDARVVYVDSDPVVTAHNRALREVDSNIGVVEADIRSPQEILEHQETHRLMDFTQPVAVLAVALLHFVTPQEDPSGILARFREVMAPGSYLALSVASTEGLTTTEITELEDAYRGASSPITLRSLAEIRSWMAGFQLTHDGLAPAADWCDSSVAATRAKFLAGIASKS